MGSLGAAPRAVARGLDRRRLRAIVLAGVAFAGLAMPACRSALDPAASGGPRLRIVPRSGAPIDVAVELATSPEKRTFGLMYRRELGPRAGMLFVFPKAEPQQFWMHNTQIPLDILYVDDRGTIARIYERTTPMSDSPLPSGAAVRFVLELAGGFCAEHGVKQGDTIELGALAKTPSS
jgi:hypothetical protein